MLNERHACTPKALTGESHSKCAQHDPPPQVCEPSGFGAAGRGAARGSQPGLKEGAHLRMNIGNLKPTPVARQRRMYVPARPHSNVCLRYSVERSVSPSDGRQRRHHPTLDAPTRSTAMYCHPALIQCHLAGSLSCLRHNLVGQGSLKKQYTHEIGCFGYIDVSSQLECLQNQRECCAPGALHVHKRRHMHGLGHILALRPEQERHPLAPGCISHLRYALPHPPAGSTLAVVHADRVLSVSSADRRCQQQHSPCACILLSGN